MNANQDDESTGSFASAGNVGNYNANGGENNMNNSANKSGHVNATKQD